MPNKVLILAQKDGLGRHKLIEEMTGPQCEALDDYHILHTKYYDAKVQFIIEDAGHIPSDIDANGVVVLCSTDDQHSIDFVTNWDNFDLDDRLLIVIAHETSNNELKDSVENWCVEHSAEYVSWREDEPVVENPDEWTERDKFGPARVLEALQCCMWETMDFRTDSRPNWGGGFSDEQSEAIINRLLEQEAKDKPDETSDAERRANELETIMTEVFALKNADDMDPELRRQRAADTAMKMMQLFEEEEEND